MPVRRNKVLCCICRVNFVNNLQKTLEKFRENWSVYIKKAGWLNTNMSRELKVQNSFSLYTFV